MLFTILIQVIVPLSPAPISDTSSVISFTCTSSKQGFMVSDDQINLAIREFNAPYQIATLSNCQAPLSRLGTTLTREAVTQ